MARAPAPSHHIFEISRGSGSCPIQQFLVAALVFCCPAVRPQTGLFLIGHNRAPQRIQKHCTCFILIETGTQLVGSISPCGWLMVSCILIPSFSRETPCQKVINCKRAQTSCCLETMVQSKICGISGGYRSLVIFIPSNIDFNFRHLSSCGTMDITCMDSVTEDFRM